MEKCAKRLNEISKLLNQICSLKLHNSYVKIVISITQSLHLHESVVCRTDIFVVRSMTVRMSNAVDGECVVQVHTISSNNTEPISHPQRFVPNEIRNKCWNQHNEQKEKFAKVSILKHDCLISSKISHVNRSKLFDAFWTMLRANPTNVCKKSSSSDIVGV